MIAKPRESMTSLFKVTEESDGLYVGNIIEVKLNWIFGGNCISPKGLIEGVLRRTEA